MFKPFRKRVYMRKYVVAHSVPRRLFFSSCEIRVAKTRDEPLHEAARQKQTVCKNRRIASPDRGEEPSREGDRETCWNAGTCSLGTPFSRFVLAESSLAIATTMTYTCLFDSSFSFSISSSLFFSLSFLIVDNFFAPEEKR